MTGISRLNEDDFPTVAGKVRFPFRAFLLDFLMPTRGEGLREGDLEVDKRAVARGGADEELPPHENTCGPQITASNSMSPAISAPFAGVRPSCLRRACIKRMCLLGEATRSESFRSTASSAVQWGRHGLSCQA